MFRIYIIAAGLIFLAAFGCNNVEDMPDRNELEAEKVKVENVIVTFFRAINEKDWQLAMPSSYTCLAVRSGGEWTLIDTGIDPIDPNLGKLLPRLSEAGIKPEDISTVIITHAHPDHIGGNTDDEGNVNFPNAQFIMWKDDWNFWTDETQLAKLPDVFGDFTRKNLPPIKDQLELLEKETEVHTGIHAIPAQVHTPGHMVVGLSSGGEELLVIGDAVLHQINISKPDWYAVYDIDPDRAVRTRKRLLERSEVEGAPLQCFHYYPFPGLGKVEKYNDEWRWEPI